MMKYLLYLAALCLFFTHESLSFLATLANVPVHNKMANDSSGNDTFSKLGNYLKSVAASIVSSVPPPETEADGILIAFEESQGTLDKTVSNEIDRKVLVDKLKLVLQPTESDKYAVIVGERGIGKSTAIRKSMFALPSPKGGIYFLCPHMSSTFSTELVKRIGVFRALDFGGGTRRRLEFITTEPEKLFEPFATFNIIRQPLLEAAAKFKTKHGRPMVLVIDAVDRLAKGDAGFLYELQAFARDCTEDGNLHVVFVTSDGSALLPLLAERSAWSRARLIEVGEISDDEAVDYLMKKGVPEDQAKLGVVNLTGGLFTSLQDFADAISIGETYEQVAGRLERVLRRRLALLKFPVKHALFEHMVKHKSVGMDEDLFELVGMDQCQLEGLLRSNILAAHTDETYTFHDRHTAKWFDREVNKAKHQAKKSRLWLWPRR